MSDPIRRPAAPAEGSMDRLLDAAVEELRASGYAALTVRKVARRAGVSPATAYNYFSSKEHLFASVYLRTMADLPPVPADGRPVAERLAGLVQAHADSVGAQRDLHEALRAALLGDDPDSRRVGDAIFEEFSGRFRSACGDDLPDAARDLLMLAAVGGLVLAGTGHLPIGDLGAHVARLVSAVRH